MKRFLTFTLALLMLLSFLPSVTADSPHTHNWKEKSRVEPTCTKDGYAVYTCSCGQRKTETLPALGHDWAEKVYTGHADCTHYGAFYWVCARCGAHSDTGNDKPLGHDWDGGVITKQPTETEEGEVTYTCLRDPSHTKTETLPALDGSSGKTYETVRIEWIDEDDKAGLRPSQVSAVFEILTSAGDETKTVTVSAGNGWTYTITDLPRKDENGKKIYYVWSDSVPGLPEFYKLADMQINGNETVYLIGYYPGLDDPQPSLKLSAAVESIGEHKSEPDNYSGGSYSIRLYTLDTVTNTGNIPLTVSRHIWFNNDESDADKYYSNDGSLQPGEPRSSTESCSLYSYYEPKDDPAAGASWTDHIVPTTDDPVYRGYSTVSICYYGYDVEDVHLEGEILCKSNVVTLMVNVPAKFGEPELTLEWKYDRIYHDSGFYDTTDPVVLGPDDGAVAHCVLTNTGDMPLKLLEHMTSGVGSGSCPDGILEPGASVEVYWGDKPLMPEITPGSETAELAGTVTYTIWVTGFDPDTGEELCESNPVVRTWKIGKDAGAGLPDGSTEYCSLSLEALGDTEARYTLHTCTAHLETASAAQKLSLAGNWAGAAYLWLGEIDKLYAELSEALGETAADMLEEDKSAFIDYAEVVLDLFGDEKTAELMRLKCAEMCCVVSTAPIRLPSSLLGEYAVLDASGTFDISGRVIGALDGSDSEVTERYAGPAAEAMAGTRALLDQAQDGQAEGLFTQAAELWKSALDEKVNAAYKAADKSVKPLVANWSMLLNILCDADSELYSLLYPTKPYIVEEHVMDLYKDAVLTIESIE